jgi:hypothetical protein
VDPDLAITIAFCVEVFLFALVTGVFIAHEVRKSRSEAAAKGARALPPHAETGTRPRSSADPERPVRPREGRAIQGQRS